MRRLTTLGPVALALVAAIGVLFLLLQRPAANVSGATAVDLAIDMDVAGNDARLTNEPTLQSCASIAGATSRSLDILIPSPGVATADGIFGWQFNLNYNPAIVNVSAENNAFLLNARSGSDLFSFSDPTPDAGGSYLSAAVDLGTLGIEPAGTSETGPGVVARITLDAVGPGVSALTLSGALLVAADGSEITVNNITNAQIAVDTVCPPPPTPPIPPTFPPTIPPTFLPPPPTPAPTPPPTPTPTPTPTPGGTPAATPTPTPTLWPTPTPCNAGIACFCDIIPPPTPVPGCLGTPTPTPRPTPSPPIDVTVWTFLNDTGQAASDLHARYNWTFTARLVENAPGCPPPLLSQTSDSFDLDWGVPCVDTGESVKVELTSGPPADSRCFYWTLLGETLTSPSGGACHWSGDVTCDNKVTSMDALFILRHVAGIESMMPTACEFRGNVDCDSDTTAVDALHILRHVAHLPSTLPPSCPLVGSDLPP